VTHNRSKSYGLGLSNAFDQAMINRRSLQNLPGHNGFYAPQVLPRRESLDFVPGHNRYPDGAPVVASSEDMRIFSNDGAAGYHRHVSPSQSPLQSSYGGHVRASSDMGAPTASPMSVGSAIVSVGTEITMLALQLVSQFVILTEGDSTPGSRHVFWSGSSPAFSFGRRPLSSIAWRTH